MENPFWEKSTRPRTAPTCGVSGRNRKSVAASVTLPRTVAAAGSARGTARESFRSALPDAVLWASALPVQPPTGDTLTKRTMSAAAPRPAPSSTSSDLSVSVLMPPCTPLSFTP